MASRRGTLAATFLGGLAVAFVGRSWRRIAIAEHSMEPALSGGDYVLARTTGRPRRGDIVTFRHPFRPEMLLVKRIIGLPGERLQIAAGQVHIDGAVLAEPWAVGPTLPDLDIEIGDDAVAVLSDNRSATISDSRSLGAIPVTALEHMVRFRYWPPAEMGRVL